MSEEVKNNPENKIQEENKNKIIEEKPTEEPKQENKDNQNQTKNEIDNMPLNSTWIFWYASRKEKDHHIPYADRLTKIAEFNTLQVFSNIIYT